MLILTNGKIFLDLLMLVLISVSILCGTLDTIQFIALKILLYLNFINLIIYKMEFFFKII